MRFAAIIFISVLGACSYRTEIPTEFPTPPPAPAVTPLPKLDVKRDAELERQFADIAKAAKGRVGAAAVVLETGDAALLNEDDHYPMQSVYKLPISMAMMDQIRQDDHALDEQIGVTPADFVRQGQASPLRDKNPNGGIFTIRELIRLALVESDGTASDVLLRVLGGPNVVQQYLSQIGIEDMKVVNTEKELGQNWDTQYQNWTTPMAAGEVLRWLNASRFDVRPGTESFPDSLPKGQAIPAMGANELLLGFMDLAMTGPNRIKGLLPMGTVVAHKTGTGGAKDGITSATNDIGIIYLPNGKHLAVGVFVSDSPADNKTRDGVIARIAKAAWNKWSK